MKTKDAIKQFGNKNKLCIHLDVTRANASNWGYWMPVKHAQSLSFDTDLEFDRDLYSGGKTVHFNGDRYKPDTKITHYATLFRHLSNGKKFYFMVDDEMVCSEMIEIDEMKDTFKNYPIYKKVTSC